MNLFKSHWFYTAIAFFVFWFTPVSGWISHFVGGWAQRNGAQTGKQVAIIYTIAMIIPVVLFYFLAKYLLKDPRKRFKL